MAPIRKHSGKRDAILRCVRETTVHPTAEWVYTQLKSQYPTLSLGTVYRNLNLFRAEGEIRSLGVVNGLERFDGNTAPHAHFVCTRCGTVLDVALPEMAEMTRAAEKSLGTPLDGCAVTFTGVCKQCQ